MIIFIFTYIMSIRNFISKVFVHYVEFMCTVVNKYLLLKSCNLNLLFIFVFLNYLFFTIFNFFLILKQSFISNCL